MRHVYSLANKLYYWDFRFYRVLYDAYKHITDWRTIHLLKHHVKHGMKVVDVGANIGFYTEVLAKLVGPDGAVFAFEPHPDNYERLQSRSSRYENITLIPSAVGNSQGNGTLYVSDDRNVDHRTYECPSREAIPIHTCRLDSFFGDGAQVDFVKMDIQGYEYFALMGMRNIILQNPNIEIILEFYPAGLMAAGTDPRDFAGFLSELQLDIKVLGRHDLSLLQACDSCSGTDRYFDILATRRTSSTEV